MSYKLVKLKANIRNREAGEIGREVRHDTENHRTLIWFEDAEQLWIDDINYVDYECTHRPTSFLNRCALCDAYLGT